MELTQSPAVVTLTQDGVEVARHIAISLDGAEVHGFQGRVADADVSFSDTAAHLRDLFAARRPIIGVCAAGILIRSLAPILSNKLEEPAVIAVAANGEVVVPLLGGHAACANELAREVASLLDGRAAVTTASESTLGIAFDAPPAGYTLRNPDAHKDFAASVLDGHGYRAHRDDDLTDDWPPNDPRDDTESDPLVVEVTVREARGDKSRLVFHPRALALGVGCERGTDARELSELVHATLADHQLSKHAIAGVFSLDLKADEPAVHALADELNVPARFFSAPELEAEASRLVNPSDVVFQEVGCHGVAEGAALAAAGTAGRLLVEKRKSTRATCAVGLAPRPIDVQETGRAQGTLAVVGIGPGDEALRAPAVADAIAHAEHVVGYSLYLELVDDLLHGQVQHRYDLGEETERVRHAIDLAGAGKNVALVCSGDAGVYAMASLVCELLHQQPEAGWSRIALSLYPGISAMQVAAARAGAPLGHDFCAISLSDLLTPRAAIERRLHAAGQGDFVIALYNPISRKRVATFETCMEIVRQYRSPETIVTIARNLGRRDESVTILPLVELTPDKVDMLCVVLIGSSNTQSFEHAGRTLAYTPRGYHQPASIHLPPTGTMT